MCILAADFYNLRREDAQYSSHDIPWDWNNRSLTSKHICLHICWGEETPNYGTLFMLLGALPLAAELHKRRLSLLHSVVSSENECLKGLVQRQLACSFNIQNSFFFIVSNILEKYGLPSLSQLVCSNYSKLQWKHIYVKAINNFWTKQFVCEIKTKKTLKYLSVYNLRIGTTHLVWRSLDALVPDVRKGIIKTRILTGTYLLQKHRHSFRRVWMGGPANQ